MEIKWTKDTNAGVIIYEQNVLIYTIATINFKL